jgi:integrase
MRKRLSPRTIKALKPGKDGIRHGDVVMDDLTPNFGIRILGTREKPSYSFVVVSRFPGSTHPVRAAIGSFVVDRQNEEAEAASLKAAKNKARHWVDLIDQGRDPRVEEARQKEAEIRRQAVVFGAVAEDFIRDKLPSERAGTNVAREIKNEFKGWWNRPISDITDEDVIRIIRAKAKTAPAYARNILGHAKRVFQWAIDQRTYGLKQSPATDIKPKAIVGEKIARDRLLTDDEVAAFWRAASKMSYPAGPTFMLLLLTGLRLSEVAKASWSEFHPDLVRALRQRGDAAIDWSRSDQAKMTWTIPASRMKGRNGKARAHAVPLTPQMLTILEQLPLFLGGDYLFSHSAGRTPAVVSTEIKDTIDARMLRTLRAMARKRGDDSSAVKLEPFVTHDLRRVVRSHLSRLKVAEEVREAVLAHVRPGIKGVYDQHDYLEEKRDALIQWGARLRGIVEPPPTPSNVVALRG